MLMTLKVVHVGYKLNLTAIWINEARLSTAIQNEHDMETIG